MLESLNQSISIALSKSINRFILAICSGLVLALSQAGYGFSFLAWFALVPLFLLIKSSESLKGSLFDAFIYFFSFNLANFIWLLALHPLTWQGLTIKESVIVSGLAWIVPSISHSLLSLIFVLIFKLALMLKNNDRTKELNIIAIFFLAFAWVVLEYKLMLNLDENLKSFFVPINMLAYSQYKNLGIIQIADIIGALGIEFLIILTNLSIANVFNVHKIHQRISSNSLNLHKQFFGLEKRSSHLAAFSFLALSFAFAFYYSAQKLHKDQYITSIKKVAILQADFSAKFTRSSEGFEKLIALQSKLSKTIKDRVDFLFWSEGAIPRTNYNALPLAKSLKPYAKTFSYGTFIDKNGETFNSLRTFSFQEILSDKPLLSKEANLEEVDSKPIIRRVTKAKSELKTDNYKKNLLVPFGEYTPFYEKLPEKLKILAKHSIGSGFQASKEIKNIETPYGNFAPSICFEILFPEHLRKFINKDTHFLVNLNDLSWFKNEVEIFGLKLSFLKGFVHRMMLAAASFRAIENNKDLVLVSNSGVSAVIRATGKRDKESQVHNIELLEDDILIRNDISFYSQYGF